MNSVPKLPVVIGGILLVGNSLFAAVPERYQTILDRNAFGLLPPPPAVTEETSKIEPPVDIKVTGFATIDGEKRVYFTIPPKTPKDYYKYLTLSEGQIESGIEVIRISESDATVEVRNGGVSLALSLKENGFQSAKGPAAVAQQPAFRLAPSPTASVSQVPQVSSPVYNPSPVQISPVVQSSSIGAAGMMRGNQPAPMQVAYNAQPNRGGTTSMTGSPAYGNTSSAPGIVPASSGSSPVYDGNSSTPGLPSTGFTPPSQPSQPNFPAEQVFNSPEEAAIIGEAEAIHNQNPKTRAEWEAYYRNMGWPADKPLPIDVAAALSPR